MEEAKKHRIKAFLWDQFVRPFYALANTGVLKIGLLAFLFVAIVIQLHPAWVYVAGVLLILVFIYELVQYYKSGEFMHNYRKYKYPDYKKATKAFKKEETKSLNTLNNLNNHEKEERDQREEGNQKRMGSSSSEAGKQNPLRIPHEFFSDKRKP